MPISLFFTVSKQTTHQLINDGSGYVHFRPASLPFKLRVQRCNAYFKNVEKLTMSTFLTPS
jgi:hypothetical protein